MARFRINLSFQKGSYMLVARIIPQDIPELDDLKLPDVLKKIIVEKQGLVLVTGATGSGKSTTVAAMLEYINKTQRKNLITLEDPIEFVFNDKQCIISQKELGIDIPTFELALKYVLRQDPDIIFVGELRDMATIEIALKAAETGHLVVSTLHTINAYQTITRILDFFPEQRHKQLRYQLSESLKGVISQRLLPTIDDKRIAVNEILRSTPSIRELMLTAEGVSEIPKFLAEGRKTYGTQTFDQAIIDAFKDQKITYETALKFATVKKDIELIKTGININASADFYDDLYED